MPASPAALFPTFGSIERLDPALDKLLPASAAIEKLAEGFDWIESPLWVEKGGYLLFSEINAAMSTQEIKPIELSAFSPEITSITSGMLRSGRRPPVIRFSP